MKIIFDSEEQKKAFFEHVAADYCPRIFGFASVAIDLCDITDDCTECWEKCGIEMEVKK